MSDEDELPPEYAPLLRQAVEDAAAREMDLEAFHRRLERAADPVLAGFRRRAASGYRGATAAGSAWWDYAARAALAAVPLGLAAALLLFAYLRSDGGEAAAAGATVALGGPGNADARVAFDSVLTGVAAPQAVFRTLLPTPAAAFLADSAAAGRR